MGLPEWRVEVGGLAASNAADDPRAQSGSFNPLQVCRLPLWPLGLQRTEVEVVRFDPCARAAIRPEEPSCAVNREESRGGHTRDDYPAMDPQWRKVNIVCRIEEDGVAVATQPLVLMPAEL
ncbi:MAG: hypothetical protein EBX81_01895, partial [bacterium]|nr:hypothetical protein [Candidatus Aquidulcis sp.]